jgi:putative dimethyl sulfoxide reductase chaperone
MKHKTDDSIEATRIAQMRAQTYGTLAAVFNQRPDSATVHNIKAAGVGFFTHLRREEGVNAEVQLREQAKQDIELSLQVDWTRLFRGVQRGYGPVPPYEGLYLGESESDLRALESVANFYSRHGVLPNEQAGNRPDYIGLELDFLCYACEQQAACWEKGEEPEARRWQEAEREFLQDHLSRWAALYCDRAIEEAKTDFYRGFVHLTKGVLKDMSDTSWPVSIGKN